MSRNLYLAAILCLTGMLAFDFLWIANNMIHGIEFYEFVIFPNLVVVHGMIILACEIIMLKYWLSKQYKVAFWISLLSMITFLTFYTLEYTHFVMGVDNEYLFDYVVIIHLIAVILFSMSMAFSQASERPLLQQAGYAGMVVGGTVLFCHVLVNTMAPGETQSMFTYIYFSVSRLGTLITIFYIMNFYKELKDDSVLEA